ncbi:MAG: LPS assembly lipoprotein LptE [Chitinophagaceae bacterium]
MTKKLLNTYAIILFTCLVTAFAFSTGCGVYSFADVSVPDSIKTVRLHFIENQARYVNPQLSPNLTDRLKQKIVNQTRLSQTNSDNAHYDISGYISDYTVTTSGISNRQNTTNRLTVRVIIVLKNQLSNLEPQEFDISRSFEFGANLSLQAAESQLLDEMVRNLTDDIFNRIFSNW